MKEIVLTKGKTTLVDDEDYILFSVFPWHVSNHPPIAYNNTLGALHRCIMNTPQGMEVDHIDGNQLNNQKYNLRNCTRIENCRNKKHNKRNTTGFKGVTYAEGSDHYRSMITVNYKHIHLGCFDIAEEAAIAYNEAAKLFYGEFANTNNVLTGGK
jgi:hypothetical protein